MSATTFEAKNSKVRVGAVGSFYWLHARTLYMTAWLVSGLTDLNQA